MFLVHTTNHSQNVHLTLNISSDLDPAVGSPGKNQILSSVHRKSLSVPGRNVQDDPKTLSSHKTKVSDPYGSNAFQLEITTKISENNSPQVIVITVTSSVDSALVTRSDQS